MRSRRLVVVSQEGAFTGGLKFGLGCLLFALALLGLTVAAMFFVVGAGA